jgi:hypothetical protein
MCLLTAPAWSQAAAVEPVQPAQADITDMAPQQILVTGMRPGPGLWKVSKGDHVLWVFGSYSPLPKNMEWRSHEVEMILAQSQEYLSPPSAGASVGILKGLTLLPLAIGLKKNPDGAALRDVLPADLYARWLLLKRKYIGDDAGIERERPLFAAATLHKAGLAQAGLSQGQEVRNAIEKIVEKNNIKTTSSHVALVLEDPAKMMKDFKKAPLDDVACFSKTLERLETDIDAMRVRANAWAKGDLEASQKLNFADRDGACRAAMDSSPVVKERPGLQSLGERMRETWLAAAEKSLATNASTLAILRLQDILDPKGYMAALEAKGYAVQKPE